MAINFGSSTPRSITRVEGRQQAMVARPVRFEPLPIGMLEGET
jgi:hypothetical protein